MIGRLVEQQDVGLGASARASAARRASPPERSRGFRAGIRPSSVSIMPARIGVVVAPRPAST